MLATAEHALREDRRTGLANALRYVWHAGNASAGAIQDDRLRDAIRRAPIYMQAMRRYSAKDWARDRHAELMANEYDRYRRSGRKEQAQRLWRDWAKGRGKERLDKNGRVTPSVSTFERYLRDF